MKSPVFPSFLCFFTLFSVLAGAQNYVPYKTSNSWGFMDRNSGKLVLDGFEEAEFFGGGYALVKNNGLWGALSANLDTAIPIQYRKIEYLSENLLKASNGDSIHLYSSQSDFNNRYSDFAFLEGHKDLIVTADENGKYGLINLEGETLIPNKYEGPPEEVIPGILRFALKEKKFFPWKESKKINFGALNLSGEEIIPFKYLFIDKYGAGLIRAQTTNEQHIYTPGGERIEIPKNARYNKRESFTEIYLGNGKIEVYAQNKGKPVIFKRVIYSDGFALGEDTNNVFQILDKLGQLLRLNESYKFINAKYGLVRFCLTNEGGLCSGYGLLTLTGKEILPPVYAALNDWNEDYAICSDKEYNGNTGVVKLASRDTVLDFVHRKITLLNCSYFMADRDGETQFYDPSFKKVKPLELKDIIPGKTMVAVELSMIEKMENEYTYKSDNRQAEFMRDCSSGSRQPMEANGLALVSNIYGQEPSDNILTVSKRSPASYYNYFLTDKNGKALTTAKYTGGIQRKSDLVIVFERDTIGNGVKTVSGALDMRGRQVISSTYDEIKEVLPNSIIVKKHGVFGVISRNEKMIIPIRYNAITYNDKGYYLLKKFYDWQIADKQGNIITKKYDEILDVYEGGLFKVKLADQVFFVDQNGKEYREL